MALRFRKRVRIAPGISINITQKGITSATVGPRGANVNIGKKGAYLNAGLPGTGIYSRTQIASKKPGKAKPTEITPIPAKSSSALDNFFMVIGLAAIVAFVFWLI